MNMVIAAVFTMVAAAQGANAAKMKFTRVSVKDPGINTDRCSCLPGVWGRLIWSAQAPASRCAGCAAMVALGDGGLRTWSSKECPRRRA